MATMIFWISLLVLLAVVAVGFLVGHFRGLKRSGLHIVFVILAFVIAIFLTKTITHAILNITITYEGEQMTLSQIIAYLISSSFDLTDYSSLETLLNNLPAVIVAPIIYMSITLALLAVFKVVYSIVARLAFGKRKEDFKEHKPHKWLGAAVGAVEAFLFLFLFLCPISSLLGIYSSLAETTTEASVETSGAIVKEISINAEEGEEAGEDTTSYLPTISELISEYVPSTVNEIIVSLDNSALGSICKIFGMNDLLFDYFSEIEIEEEKIYIRQEINLVVTIYDDFVEAYNTYISPDYDYTTDEISFTELKTSLENFLDSGLFKTVLSDTLVTYVSNYNLTDNTLGLPDVALEIVDALQVAFSKTGFDGATYLKTNILSAVDVVDEVLSNALIEKFQALDEVSMSSILQYVSDNSASIGTVANSVFAIDIVEDILPSLCSYASDYLTEYFAESNTENLKIELNSSFTDSEGLIEDILGVVDDLLSLSEEIELSSLLSGDLTSAISADSNTDELLTKLGTTLDNLRGLEILVIDEDDGTTTYVFDNILSVMDVEILGDTVTTQDGKITTLDTYTKFCDYLKTPVANAQELGFFDEGGLDFDTVIDKLLAKVTEDSTFLSDTVMPFYQLSVLSLKDTVFTEVVSLLKSSTGGLLDVDDAIDETVEDDPLTDADEVYEAWKAQFDELEHILSLLNRGSVDMGDGTTKTYIKYVLTTGYSLDALMDSMKDSEYAAGQSDLNKILTEIFTSPLTQTLTVKVFNCIDEAVESITTVKPTTFSTVDDITITTTNVAGVVDTIEDLLDFVDNFDSSNIDLVEVGKALDLIKDEAVDSGVLKPIFCNLIWYMTSDAIDELDYIGYTPYEDYEYVKAYLNTSGDGYFAKEYAKIFAELEAVEAFVNTLDSNGIKSGMTITIDTNNVQGSFDAVMQKFSDSFAEDATEADKKELVENLTTLLTNLEEPLLSSDDITNYGDYIEKAVSNVFGSTDLATSVKNLFELTIPAATE